MTIHVEPVNDLVAHEDEHCVCGPHLEYRDPDTGEHYAEPLAVHHAPRWT